MQTMAVQIQDNYVTNFMSSVNSHSENIVISRDPNLEVDPYFYERQKQLQQDLEEVENGTDEMISHNDLWSNINKHLETLK
jgi:predicted RND superfamily exporter protein